MCSAEIWMGSSGIAVLCPSLFRSRPRDQPCSAERLLGSCHSRALSPHRSPLALCQFQLCSRYYSAAEVFFAGLRWEPLFSYEDLALIYFEGAPLSPELGSLYNLAHHIPPCSLEMSSSCVYILHKFRRPAILPASWPFCSSSAEAGVFSRLPPQNYFAIH